MKFWWKFWKSEYSLSRQMTTYENIVPTIILHESPFDFKDYFRWTYQNKFWDIKSSHIKLLSIRWYENIFKVLIIVYCFDSHQKNTLTQENENTNILKFNSCHMRFGKFTSIITATQLQLFIRIHKYPVNFNWVIERNDTNKMDKNCSKNLLKSRVWRSNMWKSMPLFKCSSKEKN